jgi:hypothetical protein
MLWVEAATDIAPSFGVFTCVYQILIMSHVKIKMPMVPQSSYDGIFIIFLLSIQWMMLMSLKFG